MLERYVYKDNKKLRCGYTTGSCATAATKAAANMLLGNGKLNTIEIITPKGVELKLEVCDIKIGENYVSCAIQKDAGDDADVTDKILVYAEVKKIPSGIVIDGGVGVGRVTKKGLDQAVGAAAINSTPRKMIYNVLVEACEHWAYEGGLEAIISIPQGIELAKKTFNPRLGIEGGLSILGTSGIVEPMSEAALVDTIKTELRMLKAQHLDCIIATPGNYGESFISNCLKLDLDKSVKCSNFIGDTIDMAFEYQFKGLLIIGHIGKLVKLGAGIMNTHSKWADGRMEVLCSCALLAGADITVLKKIMACVTIDEALELLEKEALLSASMEVLMEKINNHLQHRAFEGLMIGAVVFSNQYGLLGKTEKADELIKALENGF